MEKDQRKRWVEVWRERDERDLREREACREKEGHEERERERQGKRVGKKRQRLGRKTRRHTFLTSFSSLADS
jgi:hypothetical protein